MSQMSILNFTGAFLLLKGNEIDICGVLFLVNGCSQPLVSCL